MIKPQHRLIRLGATWTYASLAWQVKTGKLLSLILKQSKVVTVRQTVSHTRKAIQYRRYSVNFTNENTKKLFIVFVFVSVLLSTCSFERMGLTNELDQLIHQINLSRVQATTATRIPERLIGEVVWFLFNSFHLVQQLDHQTLDLGATLGNVLVAHFTNFWRRIQVGSDFGDSTCHWVRHCHIVSSMSQALLDHALGDVEHDWFAKLSLVQKYNKLNNWPQQRLVLVLLFLLLLELDQSTTFLHPFSAILAFVLCFTLIDLLRLLGILCQLDNQFGVYCQIDGSVPIFVLDLCVCSDCD